MSLRFCEHPISLESLYSDDFFGGTLFLSTTLDMDNIWNLLESNLTTAGAQKSTENYNIMMENVQLMGLNLFW